jgi:CHASE3 domain sensor protein
MQWSIGNKVKIGFGLALTFLIIIGIISYRSTANLVNTVHLMLHVHTILNELDDLVFHIKNAETGQRGFIITAQDHYLEPYYMGIMNIEHEFKSIRKLIEDDKNQKKKIDKLESLVLEKFIELKETIELRRNNG